LGDDGEDLGATFVEEIESSLDSQKPVGIKFLSNSFKEDGEVMMIIELGDINLPGDLVSTSLMVNGNGKISSVVESPKFGNLNIPLDDSSSLRFCIGKSIFFVIQARALSSESFSFFQESFSLY
jgi:hypothetical protein